MSGPGGTTPEGRAYDERNRLMTGSMTMVHVTNRVTPGSECNSPTERVKRGRRGKQKETPHENSRHQHLVVGVDGRGERGRRRRGGGGGIVVRVLSDGTVLLSHREMVRRRQWRGRGKQLNT